MKNSVMLLLAACYLNPLMGSVHYIKEESKLPTDAKELYIDLIKKTVANTIYEDASFYGPFNSHARENGDDHPVNAHTMVGMKRLNNIHMCLEDVIRNGIPGDCIETGVWRGGSTILMAAILKAHQDKTRRVWVADSFQGLPPPNPGKYPQDTGLDLSTIPYLAVSLETVQSNFSKYGLLDNQVVFLKGFFKDTLPRAPIKQIALLRLDGDLYESTMDALVSLYPKLSIGGYVIIDDFGAIGACAQAVHDYRQKQGILDGMIPIDSTGVYWQKTK